MKNLILALKPYLLKLLIIPPVAAGALVLAMAIQNRAEPERMEEQESARTLRVITVEEMPFMPRAVGYGTARPAQVWQAIAEVKGRVVELHSNLNTGSFARKDDVLVRIDVADTKLAIARLEAQLAGAKSSIAELMASQENFTDSVALERQALTVAQQELDREKRLIDRGAGSRSAFDGQQRAVLAQQQKVQSIVNSLNLIPSQLDAARANLAVAEATLAERRRDLQRVAIKAPFDCRIGPVNLEVDQFLAVGAVLFEAQATERIEIEAQVALKNLRPLFDEELRRSDLESGNNDVDQSAVQRYFDIDAVVRYSAGTEKFVRSATFERIREELDTRTRAMGVIVGIDKPFAKLIDGPPPVSGTYCEVELRGKIQPDRIVVPRAAIRGENAYVLDDENRLVRRKIVVAVAQSDLAVIESGLQPGEALVVSDPSPAVGGMLVNPVLDAELADSVRSAANGEGELR